MFGLGTQELLIIMVIVIFVFGVNKLPQIGKGVGEAIRNFKKSVNDQQEIDVTPKPEEKKDDKAEKK